MVGLGFLGWWPVRTAPLVLGAALVTVTSPVRASESFPGAIQEYFGKSAPKCPVPCMLCHTRETGGSEYLRVEGFVLNLEAGSPVDADDTRGLVFALQGLAKRPCLEGMPGTICDSDLDGTPDVVELNRGTDPDGDRNFQTCIQYGCGASIASRGPERTELGPLWLVAALSGVALLRRRV